MNIYQIIDDYNNDRDVDAARENLIKLLKSSFRFNRDQAEYIYDYAFGICYPDVIYNAFELAGVITDVNNLK